MQDKLSTEETGQTEEEKVPTRSLAACGKIRSADREAEKTRGLYQNTTGLSDMGVVKRETAKVFEVPGFLGKEWGDKGSREVKAKSWLEGEDADFKF